VVKEILRESATIQSLSGRRVCSQNMSLRAWRSNRLRAVHRDCFPGSGSEAGFVALLAMTCWERTSRPAGLRACSRRPVDLDCLNGDLIIRRIRYLLMISEDRTTPEIDLGHPDSVSLHLTWKAPQLPVFYQLLSRGVMLGVQPGASLISVLRDGLGITSEHLAKRIGAVFVDGKTVLDIGAQKVAEGATLAISGVLTEPFLRFAFIGDAGSPGQKDDTTREENESTDSDQQAFFQLKIFNTLAAELGPGLLESGIWVEPEVLEDFLSSRSTGFWAGFRKAQVDHQEVDASYLQQTRWSDGPGLVKLSIHSS